MRGGPLRLTCTGRVGLDRRRPLTFILSPINGGEEALTPGRLPALLSPGPAGKGVRVDLFHTPPNPHWRGSRKASPARQLAFMGLVGDWGVISHPPSHLAFPRRKTGSSCAGASGPRRSPGNADGDVWRAERHTLSLPLDGGGVLERSERAEGVEAPSFGKLSAAPSPLSSPP